MLKLVSDENFHGDILRGLYRRRPDLDVLRVQDVGLAGTFDPDVLAWDTFQVLLFGFCWERLCAAGRYGKSR